MGFSLGEIVGKALPPTERYKFDLVELLKTGGVAVIVGGRSTNFSQEMRNDPRLEFWDSTDPKTQHRELPTNARALLFTKFNSHQLDGRLRAAAKKRGIFCKPGVHETGEIRAQLQRVVDHAPVPPPKVNDFEELFAVKTPAPEPLPPPPPVVEAVKVEAEEEPLNMVMKKRTPGSVGEFVRQHANLSHDIDKTAEAERIVKLARQDGMKTTAKSVLEFMRHLRATGKTWNRKPKENGEAHEEPVTQEAVEEFLGVPVVTTKLVEPPVITKTWVDEAKAVAPPTPLAAVKAEVRAAKRADGDTLIAAISEAEKYIGEMQAAAALLADLMPRLKSEIASFRDKQRKLDRIEQIFLD